MKYGELVRELYRRSEMQVKDYAEAIGYSTPQLSNIINDNEPGSLKALQACLRHASLDIQDCLDLPESQNVTADERRVMRAFRNLSQERRKLALAVLEELLPVRRRKQRR